jgi:hypothetical protein
MICPEGHEYQNVTLWCRSCGQGYPIDTLIDPAELLDLVEKADNTKSAAFPFLYAVPTRALLDAVKSYLKGDPSALKKMAGVE